MVSRNEHVSTAMIKNLFCCNRNKVDDDKSTVVVPGGKDAVFIFVSSNVMCRSLLGSFIQCLEKRELFSAKIEFKTADSVKLTKSGMFKGKLKEPKFNPLGLFMLWTGDHAFGRTSEVIHRFGNQHSIPKVDILYTHSPTETKKESELWFEREPLPAVHPPPAAVVADEAVVVPEEDVTIAVPTEIPQPGHPEEPVPTYEDNATAEVEDNHPEVPVIAESVEQKQLTPNVLLPRYHFSLARNMNVMWECVPQSVLIH